MSEPRSDAAESKAESGERKAGENDSISSAAAAASAKSPFRPMSDEERAELEAVYQDRGCGVECDPDSPTCET